MESQGSSAEERRSERVVGSGRKGLSYRKLPLSTGDFSTLLFIYFFIAGSYAHKHTQRRTEYRSLLNI